MLVGFIGSPCSGKTTTAAKLFAELKDMGLPAEYVAERARFHISRKKFIIRQKGYGDFSLTDEDQISIANSQFLDEKIMKADDIIVVTDSCVLNSLLYMTEETRNREDIKQFMQDALKEYDIIFICAPVNRPKGKDPNRVHDEGFSIKIHGEIETLLVPMFNEKEVHWLTGPSHLRLGNAISTTLDRFTKFSEK